MSTGICISAPGSPWPKWSGGKEHERSGAGEGSCAVPCENVRAVRGMGRELSDHALLCKVRLVGM